MQPKSLSLSLFFHQAMMQILMQEALENSHFLLGMGILEEGRVLNQAAALLYQGCPTQAIKSLDSLS